MLLREPRCRAGGARQEREERVEQVVVEGGARRELPQDRPSLLPSASTPLAKKLASGVRTSRSRLMCVTKRGPLTANVKPSGVWSRHATNDDGRCIE